MKTALIVVTLVEIALLVVVLAVYLIAIAGTLRNISRTLGLVTFRGRAIEKQTEPIGPVLGEINGALEQVASALEQVAKAPAAEPARPQEPAKEGPGLIDRVLGREGSSG